jgi:hypothetical protein
MRAYLAITIASTLPIAGVLAQLPLPEVGNLTATAMLGWYAWHTVARTIPELVTNFRAELAAERADHRAAIESLCRERAALSRSQALPGNALPRGSASRIEP